VCAYAVDDAADDEVWIWLQACGDVRAKSPADPEKLASTAHDLRAFAAQWAAAPPSRDRYPWLAHRWVGGWVTTFRALGVDHALRHEGCWTTTLLGDVLPRSTHRRVKDLLNAADGLQQRLASLPITLAHHDTQWSNAFPAEQAGRESGTVMIDWSFVGLAPAGTDLGLHVSGNLTSRAVDPQRATDHDRAATDAYLHGLRGHGWAGSTEAVLFARAASAALVAGTWLTGEASWQCPEMIAMVGDEFSTWPESLAEQQRTDVATVMEGWAATFDFLLDLGDEAIRLSDHSL
jgi:hypothetical protein